MLEPFGEIYAIRNLINGKIYVGQTTRGVQCRWRAHIKGLGSDRTYPGLKGALKKYGVENFSVEVIDTAASYEELDSKECAWIGTLDSMVPNGYNLKEGGKHAPHSAESRERNRQAQLGKKHTHEAKAKMSAVGKGRVKSPEHLAKISAALQGRRPSDAAMARSREVCTGRKMSDAFKENQRLKHLGKKDSDATREKKRQALMGRKLSEESLEKMRRTKNTPEALGAAAVKSSGRKHSAETKAKIGAASRARKIPGRPKSIQVSEPPPTTSDPESNSPQTAAARHQTLG